MASRYTLTTFMKLKKLVEGATRWFPDWSYNFNQLDIHDHTLGKGKQILTASLIDGAITNAKVNVSAAIAGTKISPDFGAQDITTEGSVVLEDTGTNKVDIKAATTMTEDYTLSMPVDAPVLDEILKSDASGNLSWQPLGGAVSVDVNMTNLSAPTAINESLISDTDNTDDLGTAAKNWKTAYVKELVLDGVSVTVPAIVPVGGRVKFDSQGGSLSYDTDIFMEADGSTVNDASSPMDGMIVEATIPPGNGTLAFSSLDPAVPFGCDILGVAYGAGLYVGVGKIDDGVIVTSTDGETWTERVYPDTGSYDRILYGVVYANGAFVAVGDGGVTLKSTDGITWAYNGAGLLGFNEVTYGAGVYVAVGDSGAIHTSPDGESWTSRTSGTTITLYGVAYGNGVFLSSGANTVLGEVTSSIDGGLTWSEENSIIAGDNVRGIAYGKGVFVIAADNGIYTTLGSVSGIEKRYPLIASTTDYDVVVYQNGRFLAGSTTSRYFVSIDGINWTYHYVSAASDNVVCMCYNEDRQVFLAIPSDLSNSFSIREGTENNLTGVIELVRYK
jgi:hypothetical protein